MGQVTIYIDDETEKKMAASARAARLSKSKWVTQLIRDKVSNEWPAAVLELAGAWKDFPSVTDIRSGSGRDAARESL